MVSPHIMGFSQKNWGVKIGVPIIRIIVFWGLYWGPPTLGNYLISITHKPPDSTTKTTSESKRAFKRGVAKFFGYRPPEVDEVWSPQTEHKILKIPPIFNLLKGGLDLKVILPRNPRQRQRASAKTGSSAFRG